MFNARKYLCVEKIFGGNIQRTERIKQGWRPAVSYLEVEDDGPDEAEGESGAPVDDVVSAHVLQVNALVVEEGERLVHVLQAVNSHFALGRARLQREREKGKR